MRKQHKAAVKACKLPKGYTLHDARHSYAVRQMQAGPDPNLVACNLGHVDGSLVMRVYGKHRPKPAEFGCSFGCSESEAAVTKTA